MTISGSLSNALSGLTTVSRVAETVSSNIANAMTEGYGRREVLLGHRVIGGRGAGVEVTGILRHVDTALLNDRRGADATLGQISARADFLTAIEHIIGSPDDPASLTGRMSDFGAALIEASSRPDSEPRLQALAEAAENVASHLNTISDKVQDQRLRADQEIARSVDVLNSSLQQIAALNGQIVKFGSAGYEASALADQRQQLVDGISELIPVREVPRDNGTVALITPGGAVLLDGLPAEIGFVAVGTIVPGMSLGAGSLSGLTINDKPVSTDLTRGPIAGGRLASLFDIRDVQAPGVQTRLDAVARDLIERFQDPAIDPTLNAGDPGLFTDGGGPLIVANEIGLAGRIALNTSVDPAGSAEYWRLRDGLGATAPGSEGDSTLLNALGEALNSNRLPATGGFNVAHSATGLASDLLSGVSVTLANVESQQAYAQAQSETLIGMELQNGVDTDAELQKLLLVEQAFAANARVVTTIDELIQTLLRM